MFPTITGRKIRNAIIGCGRISTNHIAAAVRNGFEIVAVCDILPEKMEEVFFSAVRQSEEILKDVDFSLYDDILFLSKSVGTAVASAYGGKHGLNTRNIYYTPVEASFQFMTQPGIVFTGTADTWVSHKAIRDLCEKGGFPMYVTEDGNHSLETGDVQKDLENLLAIMRTTEGYIALL